MNPTEQQKLIINHDTNAVIIAAPGSGKTFVVSEKIKILLNTLKEYEGIIAISYTNKASNELRDRSLNNGQNPKGSFFGTIDKFFIAEIIVPFAKHFFGIPKEQIKVIKIEALEQEDNEQIKWFTRDFPVNELTEEHIEIFGLFFLKGLILIETIGAFANYIFTNSIACRNYLKAKYKYIFIDEYQDAGSHQHYIFKEITKLGIIGYAVGDLNQSIYAFSGKDAKYLQQLTKDDAFKVFMLNKNHRCHASIINYSNFLLDSKIELIPVEDKNVMFYRVEGSEVNIAKWIDAAIPKIKDYFGIKGNNQIAILTRSQKTSQIINNNMATPTRVSISTELDSSLNVWSGIFSRLLHFGYNPKKNTFIDIIEEFSSFERLTRSNKNKIIALKKEVLNLLSVQNINQDAVINTFKSIATLIAPYSDNEESLFLLQSVLSNDSELETYKAANDNEVSIMTLHKSKGLEFDIVFHLDLYEWILPSKSPGPNNDWDKPVYSNWIQDLNLHYVGITRAKTACILVTSTKRTKNNNSISNAKDSEFLFLNEIDKLRYKKAED